MPVPIENFYGQEVVVRFWYTPDDSLPCLDSAATWRFWPQIVYTNAVSLDWPDYIRVERHTFENPALDPRLQKDIFQFTIPEFYTNAWVVDFDVHLLDQGHRNLPNADIVIGSEWVKVIGGRSPKKVFSPGCRVHLALSKFPLRSPIANEIKNKLISHAPSLAGASKGHSKWMQNTYIVQDTLIKHNIEIQPPIVFNPWPFWMQSTKHVGSTHYGVLMPSYSEVAASSACLNVWHGFDKFPRDTLQSTLASLMVLPKIPMPRLVSMPLQPQSVDLLGLLDSYDPVEIPVPDDDESIEACVILHISLIGHCSHFPI
jgi:hypothetical protein